MIKNVFFCNNSKNIDIWILRKEQNLFRSEFYMCVPSLVKIDWEMPVKNPRWPPRKFFFFVISTSDRGDFPRIIEIALLFHLQLSKPGWPDLSPNGTYLGLFQVIIKYILDRRANRSRDYPEHTYTQKYVSLLLVKMDYIGSD